MRRPSQVNTRGAGCVARGGEKREGVLMSDMCAYVYMHVQGEDVIDVCMM